MCRKIWAPRKRPLSCKKGTIFIFVAALEESIFETTYPGLSGFSRLGPESLVSAGMPYTFADVCRRLMRGVPQGPIYNQKIYDHTYNPYLCTWKLYIIYIHTYLSCTYIYIYIYTYLQEMMSWKSIQPIHMSQGIYPCSTVWVPDFTIRVANSTPTVAVGASRFDRFDPQKFIGCRTRWAPTSYKWSYNL